MTIQERLTFGQTYVVQSDGPIKITQKGAHGTLVKVNVTDAAGTNGREVVFTAIDTDATVEVDAGTNWSCVPGFNRGAASVQGSAECDVTVDQAYTPTSANPQSGTAVAEGLAFTSFRATLFEYPYSVATWPQWEQMNPNYLTDKIVYLPSTLEEPTSVTLPNADYVFLRQRSAFAANSNPFDFPGGRITTIDAPNAKCIWIQIYGANVNPRFFDFKAPRVVIYASSNMYVMNGALGWSTGASPSYNFRNTVCELVMPYQTQAFDLWGPTSAAAAQNMPREWRIFLPSIIGGFSLFGGSAYPPPISKESILYLLNHVRKTNFTGTLPYVLSLALAADYFDENGELIDEELKAKVTEMATRYTISFVKSNYYL